MQVSMEGSLEVSIKMTHTCALWLSNSTPEALSSQKVYTPAEQMKLIVLHRILVAKGWKQLNHPKVWNGLNKGLNKLSHNNSTTEFKQLFKNSRQILFVLI